MFVKIHSAAVQLKFPVMVIFICMVHVALATPLPEINVIQERDTSMGPFDGGVATFFLQGGAAGACGQVHSDSDMIVALDSAKFQQSLCGKQVKITNNSNRKTVTVTVADECPDCLNSNSLDLSKGAFTDIATIVEGEVGITWSFI